MVELRIEPAIRHVAGIATGGELRCHMVRGRSRLKVRGMARIALRRHRLEAAIGSSLVARVAIDCRVSSGQGEAIRVLLYLPDGDLPTADGMALFAIGAQLALVDIGVAILATLSDAGEDHFYVALGARDRRMHAA